MERRCTEPVPAERWREDAWDACCGPAELVVQRSGAFDLPLDLGQWIAPATLRGWIEEETREPQAAGQSEGAEWLLVLLTFAYAQRMFGSTEIARTCRTNGAFSGICDGQMPVAEELWRFRRKNRPLLQQVLAGVFRRAICERFQIEASMVTPELEADLRCHALERLDLARHIDGAGE